MSSLLLCIISLFSAVYNDTIYLNKDDYLISKGYKLNEQGLKAAFFQSVQDCDIILLSAVITIATEKKLSSLHPKNILWD